MSGPTGTFQPLRYEYSRLSPCEQRAYETLAQRVLRYDKTFPIGMLSFEGAERVFEAVKHDLPLLFALGSCTLLRNCTTGIVTVEPEYLMPIDEARQMFAEIDRIGRMLAEQTAGQTDLRKELILHDYLLRNVSYGDSQKRESHTLCGPLVHDRGVCDGISKAFKYLCDCCGLHSMVVCGDADVDDDLGDTVRAIDDGDDDAGHEWNMVFIDGVPYHVDITFDLGMTSRITRYDYLNLSTEEIGESHVFDRDAYPHCPRSFDVYARAGRQVATEDDITKLLVSDYRTRPGKPSVMQLNRSWGNRALTEQRITNAAWKANSICGMRQDTLYLGMNFARRVVQVTFE